jgi:hypothetical protein
MKRLIFILILLIAGCDHYIPRDVVWLVPADVNVPTDKGIITTEADCILMTEYYFNELFDSRIEKIH